MEFGGTALRELAWSTWDYLVQGGWVMAPMVAASVAMWALILERLRTYGRLGGRDLDSAAALDALGGAALPDSGPGLRRQIVDRFLAVRTGRRGLDRALLHHLTERLRRRLRSRLAVIGVLAAVAPLLGLLGTVLGMIQTFQVISLFGTSNAKAMAGGISVALVTTQTGLLIAIPGLFISGSLLRRSRRLESALDEFTLALDRTLRDQSPPPAAREATAS